MSKHAKGSKREIRKLRRRLREVESILAVVIGDPSFFADDNAFLADAGILPPCVDTEDAIGDIVETDCDRCGKWSTLIVSAVGYVCPRCSR